MRTATLQLPESLIDLVSAYRTHAGGVRQADLAEGVRRLSEMFTGRSPIGPGYLARRALRQAYVCYYLPVAYAKVRIVLRELKSFASLPSSPAILDFGSGPGAASLAAIDEFVRPRLTLVDVVEEALEDARFLLGSCGGRSLRVQYAQEPPRERFDVVLAANVLSELAGPGPLLRLLEDRLDPEGYFVLVEPALKESTRRVMKWRDDLHAAGFRIAAPCKGAERCPMLARDDMWCHQDRPWKLPAGIAELDRRLGFDKGSLKYAYLIVTRAGKTRATGVASPWRVVSNLHREKGKAWAWLCGASESLVKAELLTRHRSEGTRAFEHARRGDVLAIAPPPTGRMEAASRVRRV